MNNTNFPSNGTTRDVGGIISASSKKNTVSDSKMLIDNETWKIQLNYKNFSKNQNFANIFHYSEKINSRNKDLRA